MIQTSKHSVGPRFVTHRNWVTSAVLLVLTLNACSNSAAPYVPPPVSPPPPAGAVSLLYTTLDGPASVTSPTTGVGAGATVISAPSNDFVPARSANGFRANAVGEHILLKQVDGTQRNIDLGRGTMEFWYRPDYNHNDNNKYTIAGTGNWGAPPSAGSIHFGKHNNSNGNDLFLILYDGSGTRYEHNVRVNSYSWRAGDWVLVRFTWDFGVAAGVPNLHLYLNNTEVPLVGQISYGTKTVPAERPSEMVYIGSRDLAGSIPAAGVYDDFRIFDRAVPPS